MVGLSGAHGPVPSAAMIRSSYLRVYVPADRAERLRRSSPFTGSVIRATDSFVWHESPDPDAITAEWQGKKYVCLRYPRLRMLEGVVAFRNAYPGLGSMVIPESTVRWAAGELDRIKSETPQARSFILTSPWHVPLRWFAAFDPEMRELVSSPTGPTIRYRSSVADSRERLDRAIDTLENVGFEDGVVAEVEALAAWLAEFSGDALVELDYGEVAGLFDATEIALDESAVHVTKSIEALARGDFEEAGIHYAEVASHWASAQALTYTN